MIPEEKFKSLKEVESEWAQIRSDLFQLIGNLSNAELKKELWKHAIAGKMDIYEMLDFFHIHFERHRNQIERTLRAVSASG